MAQKNEYTRLGFTKDEILIFESLEREVRTVEIKNLTKLPRSTIVEVLKRFSKRQLVKKVVLGKKKFFVQNPLLPTIPLGEVSKITVHRSTESYISAWTRFHSQKNLRNLLYMPTVSAIILIKKFGAEFWVKENSKASSNNHITDLFIERNFLDKIKAVMTKKEFLTWVQSLKLKYVTHFVDREIFYSENDILIFQDSLFITNNKTEVSIEIKQTETVQIIKQLFESLKYNSTSVNFSEIIKKYHS